MYFILSIYYLYLSYSKFFISDRIYIHGKLDLIGFNLGAFRPARFQKAVRGTAGRGRRLGPVFTVRREIGPSYDTGTTNREPSRRLVALLNIRAARTCDVCEYFRSRMHAVSNRRNATRRDVTRALYNSMCLIHVVLTVENFGRN